MTETAIYAPSGSLGTITAAAAASQNLEIPSATTHTFIYVWCPSADLHYRTGDSGDTATSSDPVLPAGVGRVVPYGTDTHLHVLALSGSGHTVYLYPVFGRRI